MKVILFIRDSHDKWVAISTATNKKQVAELMRYANYKVLSGNDIKIVNA